MRDIKLADDIQHARENAELMAKMQSVILWLLCTFISHVVKKQKWIRVAAL